VASTVARVTGVKHGLRPSKTCKNMATPTLLITVRGPLKTVDLELPGDVPVSELLPILCEICDSLEDAITTSPRILPSLRVADTPTPLRPQQTLIDAGLFDGAVLLLLTNQSSAIFPVVVDAPSGKFVSRSVRPAEESGGIGITWETLG
jgi:hypothetical protein